MTNPQEPVSASDAFLAAYRTEVKLNDLVSGLLTLCITHYAPAGTSQEQIATRTYEVIRDTIRRDPGL